MKKMLLFSMLSLYLGIHLFGQQTLPGPDSGSPNFLSVYCTGVRIKLVQNEGESIEKILARGTTQVIFIREEHLGLPSIFFPNLNNVVPDKKSEATIVQRVVVGLRKLFREFLLSISLFNYLIEQQFASTNQPQINQSNINQNSYNEVTQIISVRK